MLRSLANLNASDNIDATLDDPDNATLLHSRQSNDVEDDDVNDDDVKSDDCDVFKCEIASLGKKAYGLVTELREAAKRR
jgi:hypothetical protein